MKRASIIMTTSHHVTFPLSPQPQPQPQPHNHTTTTHPRYKRKSVGRFYVTMHQYTTGRLATTRTGPNDARCVVWAIGEFFFLFPSFFFDTNKSSTVYIGFNN